MKTIGEHLDLIWKGIAIGYCQGYFGIRRKILATNSQSSREAHAIRERRRLITYIYVWRAKQTRGNNLTGRRRGFMGEV